jgi:MYXO-CTERM domain-containing protein
VGDGSVAFLGGLLPDPTQEFYHPYGLDAYATSYTGNQLLHTMVGWTTVFAEPPIVVENLGTDRAIAKGNATASDDRDGGDSSGLGMAAAVGAVAAAAVAVRRRR